MFSVHCIIGLSVIYIQIWNLFRLWRIFIDQFLFMKSEIIPDRQTHLAMSSANRIVRWFTIFIFVWRSDHYLVIVRLRLLQTTTAFLQMFHRRFSLSLRLVSINYYQLNWFNHHILISCGLQQPSITNHHSSSAILIRHEYSDHYTTPANTMQVTSNQRIFNSSINVVCVLFVFKIDKPQTIGIFDETFQH